MSNLIYAPYPTLIKFHSEYDQYMYRFVQGPPGSGKSSGCSIELFAIGHRQEPTPGDSENPPMRKSRFIIIRSTYNELEKTSLETLVSWLPPKYTKVYRSKPPVVTYYVPAHEMPDGIGIDMRFEFLAIENRRDLSKLDSYEATYIWLNEVTGLPQEVLGKAGERVGRYPPANLWGDGKSHITDYGVIADFNPPDEDHWIVDYLFRGHKPEHTQVYVQPSAMIEKRDPDTGIVTYELNPQAENLVNLDGGKKYYRDLETYMAQGAVGQMYIKTRLLCEYGPAGGHGKKVFTNFDREFHIDTEDTKPKHYTPTLISFDTSGIHPCCLFWQKFRGYWYITDGLYGEEMGLEEFIDDVMEPVCTTRYPGCTFLCVCDPANARDARTAMTPVDLLQEKGFDAITAPTNKFKERLQASEILLNKRDRGAVKICAHMEMLIAAMDGGYQYRQLKAEGANEIFTSTPLKNRYSHWADAFQYGALHITEGTIDDSTLELARRINQNSFRRCRI